MLRTIGKAFAGAIAAILIVAAIAVLWPSSQAPLAAPARAYVVENVRVIDVEAGTAGPPVSVVIRDGVIASIGAPVSSEGLLRVDGRDRFLVPGFWDMHVHAFQLSPQLHLPLFVASGVTSVRDMMDCPEARDSLIACVADKRRWTAAAEAGRMASPRFVEVASYYFERPELTPADVSARARAYDARSLDALKVYNRLSRPAYFRAAEEARERGMRLVGHLPKAVGLDEALAAGQASFEHAHVFARHCFRGAADWRTGKLDALAPIWLAERVVADHDADACRHVFASMKAKGVWYVPTHVTREEDARGRPGVRRRPPARLLGSAVALGVPRRPRWHPRALPR